MIKRCSDEGRGRYVDVSLSNILLRCFFLFFLNSGFDITDLDGTLHAPGPGPSPVGRVMRLTALPVSFSDRGYPNSFVS